MARKDYYAILGVRKDALPDDIRKAFRDLAKQLHPDRNPGDVRAEQRFREVAEAWEVLGDPEQRARYDRMGPMYTASGRPPSPEELNEFLRDTLGSLFGRKAGARNGEDIRYTLTLPLREAATGVERRVTIHRQQRCSRCHGTGDAQENRKPCAACGGSGKSPTRRFLRSDCPHCTGRGYQGAGRCDPCSGQGLILSEDNLKVKVPAGVATGQKLKLKGKGHEGSGPEGQSGSPGDLYVVITIEDHPLFRRRGADLLCDVPITYAEAVLGVDLRVPTLDGSSVIRIPPSTASGKSFRLPGRGMATLGGSGRGDLHVRVMVEVPTGLSAVQRAALLALSTQLGSEVHPQRRDFLDRMAQDGGSGTGGETGGESGGETGRGAEK